MVPEEICQTKGAITTTANTKQAEKHGENQGDVRNGQGDEGG
jgi:hypothetical protein